MTVSNEGEIEMESLNSELLELHLCNMKAWDFAGRADRSDDAAEVRKLLKQVSKWRMRADRLEACIEGRMAFMGFAS